MSHQQEASGDGESGERQLTFTIKASNDQKFVLTLPATTSIADLKTKLSTSEYADVPSERIRLIYSGRVLKDADSLSTYKVSDGNTIHMVKGAASNARQNPASSTSGAGAAPAPPVVPTMAAGTGNNPMAALTGARYAGFHGLPNASMFGSDGGMGAPPGPEDMLRMLDDPNFAQMMNESMNNPAVIQMLEQQPMIANNPMLRNMIRNPEMRRMMFNPEMLRMQLQMQRSMAGAGRGSDAFPMPGATDTTPTGAQPGATGNAPQPSNPFNMANMQNMFGGGFAPQTGAAGSQANPFAALFGQPPTAAAASGTTPATSPPVPSAGGQGTPATGTDQPQQSNPFANLFGSTGGAPPAYPGATGGQGGQDVFGMAQQMMQNPDMMRAMFGGQNPMGGAGAAGGDGGANPFAMFNPAMFGSAPAAQAPPDDRPPEERFAEQLRQLNDMGFFEFERNVQALRRSGGSVQGAIEFLLGGS